VGRLFITGTNPTITRCRGRARLLQGERATEAVSGARTRGRPSRGWLPGGYEVHLKRTRPGRGSSGCWTAINRQIHGVLTSWGRGWRVGSGGDRRGRSSRTLPEGGSVVTTAVTAMGGRGRTTGRAWLIVPAPGAGWILAPVSRASMVKRTNGARGVGGGASLMGVSVSPAVLTLGDSGGGEGKFDLAFLREDDDPGSEGRYVVGVDRDNHRSGLLGCPRISARLKVPG